MNITFVKENLKVGMRFKNREELSRFIDEPYITQTNPKEAQNKRWRKYFDFKKVEGTRKIVITEKYEKERECFSVRGSSFPQKLDPEILSELKAGEVVSNSQIAERIGITSKDVIKFYGYVKDWKAINIWLHEICTTNDDLDEEKLERKFKAVSYFASYAHSSYNKMIEKSLERLKKKKLIDYEQGLMIYFPKDYIQNIKNTIEDCPTMLNKVVFPWLYKDISKGVDISQYTDCKEYLEDIFSKNEIYEDFVRLANKEEEHLINSIKKEVLKKFKCESEKELISSSRWDRNKRVSYFNAVNKKLSKYNIKAFKGYYIKTINEDVEYDKENRSEINTIFYNKMIHNNIKICERNYQNELQKEKYPKLKEVGLRKKKYADIKFFKEFAEKFLRIS